jgi:Fibronectin type III domain
LIAGLFGPTQLAGSPGAPRNVFATTGVASSTVTWTAPSPGPLDPIVGYTVTALDATTNRPEAPQILPAGTTSAEFDKLRPGDKYSFSVEATNADGTGPAVSSNSVVPVTVAVSTSDSGSSSGPAGTAVASIGTAGQPGSLSASASGSGTVTVGSYPSAPLAGFPAGQTWFDVSVAPGSAFSSLRFTVCGIPQGDVVEWWNPTQQALSPASEQTAATSGGCIAVTVTATTSPAISDLFGTIFSEGVAAPAPPGTTTTTTTNTTTTPIGTTTTPPVTSPRPRPHAGLPRIVVSSKTLKVRGGKTNVLLACKVANCSGTARLTTTRSVVVKKGKKTIHKRQTVVLASRRYKLAAGKAKSITLVLSPLGRTLVRHASNRRPVSATLTVTVADGKKVARAVRIA